MQKPHHDWYLKAWMKTLRVKQSDIMKVTGYSKATMSDLATGKQRFNRDILNEVSRALNILPHELLLHPDEAMGIRRLRESAARIVADHSEEGDNRAFG